MVQLTPVAAEKVRAFLEQQEPGEYSLRILAHGFGFGLELVTRDQETPDDEVSEQLGVRIIVDRRLRPRLEGATVDYEETVAGAGFRVVVPEAPAPPRPQGPLAEKIDRLLAEVINPGIASHGGRVELVDLQGATAFLRMSGGCQGCGMADVTLRQGVETLLREAIPELEQIVDLTDHASGTHPYFARED